MHLTIYRLAFKICEKIHKKFTAEWPVFVRENWKMLRLIGCHVSVAQPILKYDNEARHA